MATIEDSIFNKVSTDSGVTALVSTRLYPLRIAQGATIPAVEFHRKNTNPDNTMASTADIFYPRIEFSCWAKTASSARAIAAAIKTCLEGFQGTLVGIRIWGILYIDESQFYDPDSELYLSAIEFEVLHAPYDPALDGGPLP